MSYPPRGTALLLLAAVGFSFPAFGKSLSPSRRGRTQQSLHVFQDPRPARPPAKPAAPSPSPRNAAPTAGETDRRVVTLENLFAADSYKLYGEVRMVGNLVRSPGVVELLEPIMKLSSPPQEFKALVKFLNTNADALSTSPMLFAAWPTKGDLPMAVVAIELPSVEEAQKLEPKLQTLLPVIFPSPSPTPSPTPTASPKAGVENNVRAVDVPVLAPQPSTGPVPSEAKTEKPPFLIKRSGSLILITSGPFTFKSLRPVGSMLLAEDQKFRVARDRFSTEPLFVYYNVGLEDEDEKRRRELAAAREGGITVDEMTVDKKDEAPVEPVPDNPDDPSTAPETLPSPEVNPNEEAEAFKARQEMVQLASPSPEPTPNPGDPFLSSLFGSMGWGPPAWPDAVGVAVAFENDSYVVRVLLIDPPDTRTTPIPFVPQIIAGRAVTAGVPGVVPADFEFYAAFSLDLPRMYAALLDNMTKMTAVRAGYDRPTPGEKPPEPADTAATEAAFEKKYGFKIKEELLPALGSEIAIGGTLESVGLANQFGLQPPPQPTTSPATTSSSQLKSGPEVSEEQAAKNAPVFFIEVKDRDAVKGLIPRLMDAMGVKALGLLAKTERRDDTEMVTFAGAFSYAFVDKFMVLSPSVAGVRHVVDSYVKHETLSSDTNFRNLTRWQPRETQGQFYVAPSVMAGYHELARNPTMTMDAGMRDFVAKLSPAPEAVSYALSNGGFGPLHELHLPKNLILMMVAGISAVTNRTPLEMNEEMAKSMLYMIAQAEVSYKQGKGKGSYGTFDQLAAENLVPKGMLEKYGYNVTLSVSGAAFQATATPKEYGTTGRLSFFIDETSAIRGGDRNGGPASASDPPMP